MMKAIIVLFVMATLNITIAQSALQTTNNTSRSHPEDFIYSSEDELKKIAGKSATLANLRRIGWDEQAMFRIEESYEFKDGIHSKVATFDEWMSVYNGTAFAPPISFDYAEPWTMDFSTPVLALHSYWRCMHICDAETAFRHSDPSYLNCLEKWKPRCFFRKPKLPFPEKHTKVTIFLSGSSIVNGKEYTLLLYRRENPHDPKNNQLSFHVAYFVQLNGKYYRTDLDTSSFASLKKCMGVDSIFLVFKNFDYAYSKLKDSAMPQEFYILQQ